jgi:predicted SAM-dependent methyltransferase
MPAVPGEVKLNVGCGSTVAEGWVNIDRSPSVYLSRFPRVRQALLAAHVLTPQQGAGFPAGVVHANVARHIPVGDHSADFVYSSHMIEHLSRWEGLRFVRECRRVLKPGGVLRLATPDLETMVRDYINNGSPFMINGDTPADAFCAEYNAYANADVNPVKGFIRKFAGGDSHQWLYDHTSIERLLNEGGFSDVRRCTYREGKTPDLVAVEHRERSLFVEASAAV